MEKYEIDVDIRPDDIDQLGHVNNTVYLRWVQEAAVAHWQVLAPHEDQEKLFWVVVRHEIDYKRPALLHDNIIARTWVGKRVRRNFERHTEIIRVSDGKVFARALTLWCPMDRKTGRPTDVSEAVRNLFSVPEYRQEDLFLQPYVYDIFVALCGTKSKKNDFQYSKY